MTTSADGKPPRPLGVFAIIGAILAFSISSSLIKKAGAPGPTIAFWRMALSSVVWASVHRVTTGRFVSRAEYRAALVPGLAFGLNITLFFTAITHTTVANAEFIGALSPLVLVPAGALLFHERINLGALVFGLVSLVGLTLVLFFGPSTGEATVYGNLMTGAAVLTWCAYLLSSRAMRTTMGVIGIMAAVMPVSTLTVLPIAAASGQIDDVSPRAAVYIVVLVLLTGTLAHGLIVFAQRTVPVGTIGIMQVAQPALAVGWSVVLLGNDVRPVQVAGMVLVLAGLVLVTLRSQR